MPYKVSLTLVSGERTQLPEIYHDQTPSGGDTIIVYIRKVAARARVTGVRTHRFKSSGTAGEAVDDVDAQEM
jgi:hypothetical protein